MNDKTIKHFIYGLQDPTTNEIRYVGRASHYNRVNYHFNISFKKNNDGSWKSELPVHRWIRKLDGQKYNVVIIEKCPDNVEDKNSWLNEKEIFYITEYRKNQYLLNCVDGGMGILGWKHSEESLEKIRNAGMGKTFSEERRRNISESLKGEKNPRFGKPGLRKGKTHSEETKKLLSEVQFGKKMPKTSGNNHWTKKEGAIPANKGRKFGVEFSEKQKQIKLGKKYPNRKGTAVRCLNDGNVFKSQDEAVKFYKTNKSRIYRSARFGIVYDDGLKFELVI